MPTASELPIDTSASAMDMAESMFGSGVEIVSADYTGHNAASGVYSNGDTVAPNVTPADTGVILSTGRATSITNSSGDANTSSGTSGNMRTAGDADLNEIAGANTYDAAIFEATFVPDGSTLTMQVTFSSEEYLEYCGSGFNDAVGIWVNGVQAELTIGDGDITINNINDESNSNLYIDNPANDEVANTEMDGFTVTLSLNAPVTPGEENTIRIGIADGGDRYYDSNLLIAGDSVQCALVAGDDDISVQVDGSGTFDLLGNDSSSAGPTLTITMINGQPVVAGDTVTLATGEVIVLNPDGTITLWADDEDGTSVFTYEVTDADGNTDIGYVTVETTPCFTAGSVVQTPNGPVAVETLCPGDLVLTRDNGLQPLRWIGVSKCFAAGQDAPVRIAEGTFGAHQTVEFSPNHRVLYRSERATLLFGEPEVLVKARDLLNGTTVTLRRDGRPVTYVHLLFDRHEIVTANGLASESYHPGQETLNSFDADTRAEILRLMPGLADFEGVEYGPAARLALRPYEAQVLLASA
ncbi:choice-of-anchor L domain-containing protein [Thalassobius sp. S69A]|uniref:choice-of-anchor L domain-containing protein n=1 Tax=unclassified Thalassovita TaxID=2619711 RepID=UPI000C0D8F8E|nr:2,3,4,5-tetrahydropyridine-2,6-carboxylate N-succinyltransferase [Paracoccaceae bacterium]MBT25282.1 2,3,4,5-tetrahydropyridine-2,6-carboxylate N-succinyltransferase [Paracoccaceae bacterium]